MQMQTSGAQAGVASYTSVTSVYAATPGAYKLWAQPEHRSLKEIWCVLVQAAACVSGAVQLS